MADDRHIVRTAGFDWAQGWRGRHPFNPASEMTMLPLGVPFPGWVSPTRAFGLGTPAPVSASFTCVVMITVVKRTSVSLAFASVRA